MVIEEMVRDRLGDALRHGTEATEGVVAIESTVHWDNEAMLALNSSLGANIERVEGDWDHALCVLPIR